MAKIPTAEQVKKIQKKTQTAIDNKIRNQRVQGKEFAVHGGGVIPEKIWKAIKEPRND